MEWRRSDLSLRVSRITAVGPGPGPGGCHPYKCKAGLSEMEGLLVLLVAGSKELSEMCPLKFC